MADISNFQLLLELYESGPQILPNLTTLPSASNLLFQLYVQKFGLLPPSVELLPPIDVLVQELFSTEVEISNTTNRSTK